MSQEKPILDKLLKIETLDEYPDNKAIQLIGTIQDQAYDNKLLDGMNHALKLAESIRNRKFSKRYSAYFNYTVANIWFDRYKLSHPGSTSWIWESDDYVQIVIHYRKALRDILEVGEKNIIDKFYYSQITTNLSNNLSHLGRIIEAIEGWNRCLLQNKSIGMARGNLGYGLMHYSKIIYDSGHKAYILREAYKHLKQALEQDITDEAKNGFSDYLIQIESLLDKRFLQAEVDLNKWELGVTKEEKEYRKWCLKNILFLNPLNDLGDNTIASTDILHLPDIITKIDDKPFHHGLFNVIKQEYVSARFLLYESIQLAKRDEQHFSDKDNHLVDTLDYSLHSLGWRSQVFDQPSVQKQLKRIVTGSNVYGLSKTNLAKVEVKLPSKKEQLKIVTVLQSAERDIRGLKEFENTLRLQKKGLMQQLLTGKTRVKVN